RKNGRADHLGAKYGAFQVEVHDLIQYLLGLFQDRPALNERASVVNQNIDRTELIDGALHQRTNLAGSPDIRMNRNRLPAGGDNAVTHLLGAFLIAMVSDGDAGAQIRQHSRGGGANPG